MASLKPLLGIGIVLLMCLALAWAGSQGSVMYANLPLLFICAGIGIALHWLIFIPSFIFQTEHYFDLTGAISFLVTVSFAIYAYPTMDTRSLVLCALIAIWSLRLGSFLFMRVKRAGQDRRFNELKKRFFRFMFTWTLGGAWVFITAAAALAAITSSTQRDLDVFFVVGVALWLVGFGVEVIADRQKSAFRRQSENENKFITTGLWAWSRHPNYFGEILLWIGIAIIALPVLNGWQYFTLVSPLFVILLLTKVSGVVLLEKSAEERWGADAEYQSYRANTPALVPWTPNTNISVPNPGTDR